MCSSEAFPFQIDVFSYSCLFNVNFRVDRRRDDPASVVFL